MRTEIRLLYTVAGVAVLTLGMLCSISCHHARKLAPPPKTTQHHGPLGAKLREAMRDPTADSKLFDEVATLAANLSDAAGEIAAEARDREISPDDRSIFDAQAATLQAQARELQQGANEHRFDQVRRSFDRVNATCVECHTRFHTFAGDLPR